MKYQRLKDVKNKAEEICPPNESWGMDTLIDNAYQLGRKEGWQEVMEELSPLGEDTAPPYLRIIYTLLWRAYEREEV
jgi:hypothetical protein